MDEVRLVSWFYTKLKRCYQLDLNGSSVFRDLTTSNSACKLVSTISHPPAENVSCQERLHLHAHNFKTKRTFVASPLLRSQRKFFLFSHVVPPSQNEVCCHDKPNRDRDRDPHHYHQQKSTFRSECTEEVDTLSFQATQVRTQDTNSTRVCCCCQSNYFPPTRPT